MKIRSIHPDFFSDARICEMSMAARLLFQGLWLIADDYGRGRWLPKKIEGMVFPRDHIDVDSLLNEIIKHEMIRLYTDGTEDFYEVRNWERYQSPKYRAKTTIPDPETLENPYRSGPGQLRPIPAQVVQELSPGEGEERERRGRGSIDSIPNRNQIWDTLVSIYGEPTPPQRSLYGRVTKFLTEQDATPNDIQLRAQALVAKWGPDTNTVTALEKHWNFLASPAGTLTESSVEEYHAEVQRQRRLAELEAIDNEKRLER